VYETARVLPAIDLRDGRVVQLVGGDPDTEAAYGDPVSAAERWVDAGARALHVVDLDGALAGERGNAAAVGRIVDAVDVPVQVGGGIRSVDTATRLLDDGVDRVILGTAAVEDPAIVTELADRGADVVVSLDARDGEVVVGGWTEGTGMAPEAAAAAFADRGAVAILFTDVDVEGRMAGVRTDRVSAVADASPIPVVASGGVGSADHVRALRNAGAAAVVVGSALYEGVLDLDAAREAAR
jgi:phosphoribosylformimino-5-aminoimidazole carboxamide ribotide isomerase